jgi:hypothetical protein
MKAKTARRRLQRNQWKCAMLGKKARMNFRKPYLKVLKYDLNNPASIRVYNVTNHNSQTQMAAGLSDAKAKPKSV